MFLVGAEELAEPIEVAYESEEAAKLMADEILAQGLPVRLGHHPAETPFARAFAAKARKAGLLITAPTAGSPFIQLDESWQNGIERFNARRRSDFRRMRRRAEAEGDVSFQFLVPSPQEVGPMLELALEVEAKGWKSRTLTAVAYGKKQLSFFRRYSKLAAREGIFRVNFMKIGSRIVAMQIAAECNDRFWLFKIGYDEQFARCSPGQLLMLESIGWAARNGLETFEFLGKAADWTKFWTESERPRARMLYYPKNPYGAAAFARDATVIGSRRLRSALAKTKAKESRQRT